MLDLKKLAGLAAAALMALGLSGGAHAAPYVSITGTFPGAWTPGSNDFVTELGAAGAPNFGDFASFTLSGPAILTFTAVAAESGFDNNFVVDGLGTLSETGDFGEATDFLGAGSGSLSGVFAGGSLNGAFRFTSNDSAAIGAPLTALLGVFVSGGNGDYTTFFLAFDDLGASPEDNHDDFIIRVDVSAVPLPAAAWLMLAGLGGLGLMSRRRSAA